LWFLKNAHAPVTAIFNHGVVDYNGQSGVHLNAGYWLDAEHDCSVEVGFFQLEQAQLNGSVNIPVVPGATPTFVHGLNRLWGAELNGRTPLCAIFFADHLDFLFGLRHLQFGEGLDFTTSNVPLPMGQPPTTGTSLENIRTLTQFFGGQVGLSTHWYCKGFSIDLTGKVAVGSNYYSERASSFTYLSVPGGNPVAGIAGGAIFPPLLNDKGHRGTFGVLPEFTATGGYQIMPGLRVLVGYTVLDLDSAVRAPAQVDPVILNGGPYRPRGERFYAQGVNLGFELSY